MCWGSCKGDVAGSVEGDVGESVEDEIDVEVGGADVLEAILE